MSNSVKQICETSKKTELSRLLPLTKMQRACLGRVLP